MTRTVAGLIMTLLIPAGYWPLEKSRPIVEKTQTIRLAPDTSKLSAGERQAVAKLIEVGRIFQQLYELQRHQQALTSFRNLEQQEVERFINSAKDPEKTRSEILDVRTVVAVAICGSR